MTAHPLLLKGFEVELFTGQTNGANVGVATDVARELPGFVTEPDCRNLEYVTDPIRNYAALPRHCSLPGGRYGGGCTTGSSRFCQAAP